MVAVVAATAAWSRTNGGGPRPLTGSASDSGNAKCSATSSVCGGALQNVARSGSSNGSTSGMASPSGPARRARSHDLILAPAAQQEHQEWVLVEALAEQVVHRGDVLARIRPVGTRAPRAHVAFLGWKQRVAH
jgi:hypothetical protein